MGQRIQFPEVDVSALPKTFEEWVEIHGEPTYIGEQQPRRKSDVKLVVPEEEEEPQVIQTDEVFYTDEKTGKVRLDYAKFLDRFKQIENLVYCNGTFYSPDGRKTGGTVRSDIHGVLKNMGWRDKFDVPVNSLYRSLMDECYIDTLPVDRNTIPLANGDLHIGGSEWEFHYLEKKQAPYRLAVDFMTQDAPMPLFEKWLKDLFTPDDIITVQEIFGYCLVPVTAAQEAFFLVGEGGTGKSGIGLILKKLLGNAFEEINTQDLVTQRFQVASVENKLVAYDDDLGSAALVETGLMKKLITADTAIPAERKNENPYTFMSYCRIIAGTNIMLSSLHDDTSGFFRRLHPILVKPKDPNRKDIDGFYQLIAAQELPQILRWSLVGLRRLIANGWKVHWSKRSLDYMENIKSANNHFDQFFDDTLITEPGATISVAEIKKLYSRWCKDNATQPVSERRLERWISDAMEEKGIESTRSAYYNGKRVRGYKNLTVNEDWDISL